MQPEKLSNFTRPHKQTYKVCRELAAQICSNFSDHIKAFAFYTAIRHYSQSSSLSNWRKNIDLIKSITGINSENTIRKRIKDCYRLGYFHGSFSQKHIKCKRPEYLLKIYGISLKKESVTSISKQKINGTRQIESFIKICAFDKHRDRQIYAEKKSLALKELNIKTSNKEKLSNGIYKLVKKKIRSIDDKSVLFQIRAGRRKLGNYIQRSGVTATRVIKKAKQLKLVRDVHHRPQLLDSMPPNFEIDQLQLWAMKKFKTYAFYKNSCIWLKYANSVYLNKSNEYKPEPGAAPKPQIQKIPNTGQSVCFTF